MHKATIIDKIQHVLARHRYVVKAELFGSLVKGTDQPGSDVDLLVVYDSSRPKGFGAFSIFGDLEKSLGRRVDIVQEHLLHDSIRKNIQNARELIYERQ